MSMDYNELGFMDLVNSPRDFELYVVNDVGECGCPNSSNVVNSGMEFWNL